MNRKLIYSLLFGNFKENQSCTQDLVFYIRIHTRYALWLHFTHQ